MSTEQNSNSPQIHNGQFNKYIDQIDEELVSLYDQLNSSFCEKQESFLDNFMNDNQKFFQKIRYLEICLGFTQIQRKMIEKLCDRYSIVVKDLEILPNGLENLKIEKTIESKIPQNSFKQLLKKFKNQNQSKPIQYVVKPKVIQQRIQQKKLNQELCQENIKLQQINDEIQQQQDNEREIQYEYARQRIIKEQQDIYDKNVDDNQNKQEKRIEMPQTDPDYNRNLIRPIHKQKYNQYHMKNQNYQQNNQNSYNYHNNYQNNFQNQQNNQKQPLQQDFFSRNSQMNVSLNKNVNMVNNNQIIYYQQIQAQQNMMGVCNSMGEQNLIENKEQMNYPISYQNHMIQQNINKNNYGHNQSSNLNHQKNQQYFRQSFSNNNQDQIINNFQYNQPYYQQAIHSTNQGPSQQNNIANDGFAMINQQQDLSYMYENPNFLLQNDIWGVNSNTTKIQKQNLNNLTNIQQPNLYLLPSKHVFDQTKQDFENIQCNQEFKNLFFSNRQEIMPTEIQKQDLNDSQQKSLTFDDEDFPSLSDNQNQIRKKSSKNQ